jgi:BirA family biotin operon repressor/biotin-[acetyl-CoA-carboxylase] ligase
MKGERGMDSLESADWQRAKKFLSGRSLARGINSTPQTPSTQTQAKEAARGGAPHGEVFVTDFQSAGRGRRDRGWQSLPGKDLSFSAIIRLDAAAKNAPLLSLAAAVAVVSALKKVFSGGADRISIKWPNDILADGKKICGIICECAGTGEKLDYAVVGIGINVNRLEDELPGQWATSLRVLRGRPLDLPELLASILSELDRTAPLIASSGGRLGLLGEYRATCGTTGRVVRIKTDEEDFEGTAVGISDDGSIIVDRNGLKISLNAADVVHATPMGS